MPKGTHHLTYAQRCQISALLASGQKQTQIASHFNVNRSTISREIQRNAHAQTYDHERAHQYATQRRSSASKRPYKMTPSCIAWVEDKLAQQWSPQQISGRYAEEKKGSISHETIYQHIWLNKKNGGTLWKQLRHNGKKYNRRKGKTAGRGLIPGRVDISERPAIVEEKSRIGDIEADTIIGAHHKGAIVSLVDRCTKFTKLILVEDKTSDAVSAAILHALSPMTGLIKTITFDNGKEFAKHHMISETTGAQCFFATPYHSWERGLNEHTNGLVRQYFPKGSAFDTLSHADVSRVESLLNNRPRKCLGYKTPLELFSQLTSHHSPVAFRS